MFYDRESISKNLALIRNKISGVIHIPMPSYKLNDKWTDEFRIRDGHIKLNDGTWVTEVVVEEYLGHLEKNALNLYDNYQKSLQENRLIRHQNREMEYALRVAEKTLKKTLTMTKEMIDE